MSITTDLEQILSARYGKDVRQAIHDSIEEGYNIAVQAQGTAETSQESAKAYATAALASEQAAQMAQQAAEDAAEQAMSGTPTGYAALVAKVNSIYQETASSFSLVDTVEGLALAHTIYGMSEQDGTPTPSVPVDIDNAVANFKCVGKNLNSYPYYNTTKTSNGVTFTDNGDGTITTSGTATADAIFLFHARSQGETNDLVLPNGNYVVSGCPSGGASSKYYIGCGRTYGGVFNTLGDETGTGLAITLNGDDFSDDNVNIQIAITIKSGINADGLTFYPMITLANADQTWEEYKSKAITTDLTLRAIEVTSSDDYNLEKDGKYYIADTLDWDEDSGYSITRRIASITFDGENYQAGYYTTVTVGGTTLKQVNLLIPPNDVILKVGPYVTCSILKTISNSASRAVSTIYVANATGIVAGYFDSSMEFTSTATFNTWASENPFELQYVLATPTSESVTSAQAQALLGLKTYDEATSIDATGDIEPSVDLEYSKDRNTALALTGHNLAHKNALKLNDINTALIELGGN